jgi:ABC-type lipopolysaccharide export system ATPase subunit
MVASTLHQCIKYVKDAKQRRINGDIRPFGVHEVKYEEARYFNSQEKARSNGLNRRKLETRTK